MSENLRNYTKAVYILDAVAARVPANAWTNPSCCDDWSAQQVAGHASWLIKRIGNFAAGAGPTRRQPEDLGINPGATVRQIIATTLSQLDSPQALQRTATTSSGDMTVDEFIGLRWLDAVTHAWDIADAVGIDHGIDDPTAIRAFAHLQGVSAHARSRGMFKEPVETWDAVDPVGMYIAYSGRTSVRQPAQDFAPTALRKDHPTSC